MDPFFAVAYFQMGVSHFLLNDMEAARQDFDLALEVILRVEKEKTWNSNLQFV